MASLATVQGPRRRLPKAKQTFSKLCAPCHRADAGGLVGPNLCDDYWIHGSNFVDNLQDDLERRAGQRHDHLEEYC